MTNTRLRGIKASVRLRKSVKDGRVSGLWLVVAIVRIHLTGIKPSALLLRQRIQDGSVSGLWLVAAIIKQRSRAGSPRVFIADTPDLDLYKRGDQEREDMDVP